MKKIYIYIIIGIVIISAFSAFGAVVYKKLQRNEEKLTKTSIEKKLIVGYPAKVQYRRKITLPNIENEKPLANRQIFIKLDTASLIQGQKLSFDCSNLYFTDLENKNIPFWMDDGECYKKESVFWLNISNTAPYEKKAIYVYYGNEKIAPASNFEKVFLLQNTLGLVAGYFLGPLMLEKDFSGFGNNGELMRNEFSEAEWWSSEPKYFFNHWGCGDPGIYDVYQQCGESDFESVNFTASSPKNIDFSQGTIEMWIKPSVIVSENYQKIIMDSKNSIELGIQPDGDLYFYPSQAGGKNYNLIKKPFIKDSWAHIVVVWDYKNKESIFYINGKKIINNIENIPTFWTEKTQIGNKWKIGGFAYAGYIEGLRIYSKILNAQEIADSYNYNNRNAIGPKIILSDEEIILQENGLVDSLKEKVAVEEILTTDKIQLTYIYSTPLEGSGIRNDNGLLWIDSYEKYSGYLYNSTPIYLLSKNNNEKNIIFGYPSHFDSYIGTPININGSYLLTHIGFKINNLSLIKQLYVELGADAFFGLGYNNIITPRKSFFDYFIPTVYSCGGGSYREIGESELNFVGEQTGTYWYELKTPILASNAESMQISYIPSGKEGFLSIELTDMIFRDQNQKFIRPQRRDFCSSISDTKTKEECYFRQEQHSAYFAYLALEENGNITFQQEEQEKNLLMVFKNQGKNSFKIDEDSFKSIQSIFNRSKIIKNLNIRNMNGDIIYSVLIENIQKEIMGVIIKPEDAISLSLKLPSYVLNNSASYWLTLGSVDSTFSINQNQRKIIHWTFGESPYYFPPRMGGDIVLYKLNIDTQGKINIIEASLKDFPK